MITDPHDLYAALRARDARFDGRFFVGVSSTRVYCRPVCAVRTPRPENCSFFPSPAAAEARGFRPCLRCRPELAPGLAPIDAAGRYAVAAARLIEQGFLSERPCSALAARLGITDRHLRRVFAERFGTTPTGYAQSQRLLLAKRLLAETSLPVTDVALAAGFGSLGRFNALVRSRYRLAPTQLRQRGAGVQGDTRAHGDLALRLAFRPPLDWTGLLRWLATRAVPGVEMVEGDTWSRSLAIGDGERRAVGWVRVSADLPRAVLVIEPSASLVPVLPQLLARLRRLFDLDAAPQEIAEALGGLAAGRPGLRLPGAASGFEGAVSAVLEQRNGPAAAARLAGRLAERFGERIDTPWPSVGRLFPSAHALAQASPEALAAAGLPPRRARTVQRLATEAAAGRLDLDEVVDIDAGIARLRRLPGIGPRTARCIAMRAWSWPDAFPDTDPVLRRRAASLASQASPLGPRALAAHARRWSPWRSYAAQHLWQADE